MVSLNMQVAIYLFLYQCVVIYNDFNSVHAKTLVGENVQQATENDFSFVVAIVRINNATASIFKVICIGTLVTKKDVISAEHCLQDEQTQNIQIIAGSINITCGIKYPVFWWLTYDQWATQTSVAIEFPNNDIAMIRLLTNVADEIDTAFISFMPNHNLFGLEATIATWSTSNTGQLSTIMETGNVIVLSNTDCEIICKSFDEQPIVVPERMICTVAEPCILLNRGDSGGPLLYEATLIAINTGVYPALNDNDEISNQSGRVNYHFGVHYYKQYITSVMNMP